MLNNIKTYVINLEKRKDRLELLNIPFKWERFNAIEENPGYVGCLKSHQEVIKKSIELDLDKVLIFEDDVELCENFENKFNDIIQKLPNNWDLLYLGGWNKGEIKKYDDGINIAENVFCMHAYLVNRKFIPILFEILHSKDNKQTNQRDYKCDVLLSNNLNRGNCFICDPPLAWQKAGYSDIEKQITNNIHLKENGRGKKAIIINPLNKKI